MADAFDVDEAITVGAAAACVMEDKASGPREGGRAAGARLPGNPDEKILARADSTTVTVATRRAACHRAEQTVLKESLVSRAD